MLQSVQKCFPIRNCLKAGNYSYQNLCHFSIAGVQRAALECIRNLDLEQQYKLTSQLLNLWSGTYFSRSCTVANLPAHDECSQIAFACLLSPASDYRKIRLESRHFTFFRTAGRVRAEACAPALALLIGRNGRISASVFIDVRVAQVELVQKMIDGISKIIAIEEKLASNPGLKPLQALHMVD